VKLQHVPTSALPDDALKLCDGSAPVGSVASFTKVQGFAGYD
jgi:hypothetical protein